MSIFGKKTGANPADGSEVLLSKDFTDSGEELTEIEKTRRDLMVARLESFKREAAEQAAAESQKASPGQTPQRPPESVRPVSITKKPVFTEKPMVAKPVSRPPTGEIKAGHKSPVVQSPAEQVSREVPPKPVSPVKEPVGANQPMRPAIIPQVKDSDQGETDSFITRSATPRPSRKPPEPTKKPAKPIPAKPIAPEKSPEHTKPMSMDTKVSEKEKPAWRIKPKVESRDETQFPEKKAAKEIRQAIKEKPGWRAPPKGETEVKIPAPKKTAMETSQNEESDLKPAPEVSVPGDSQKTRESVTGTTESSTGPEDTQVKKLVMSPIALPYGEVPRKTGPTDEIETQIPEKPKEIRSGEWEISGAPPKSAAAVSFEAADFRDARDAEEAAKASEAGVIKFYPKSSGRYNHYDQYHQNRDKLIDDIMFGIVNADIAARRRQMTKPESEK